MPDKNGPVNNGGTDVVVMADSMQSRHRTRMFRFRLFLGLCLFAWLALLVDWDRIEQLLFAAEPWSLLSAFFLVMVARPLTALKWYVLIHAKQLHPPYLFLLQVV